MKLFPKSIIYLCLLFCGTMLSGCFYRSAVHHIASEISMAVPNQTTQEEVLSLMGFPEKKRKLSQNEEEWIYVQTNKSLLRKAPLFGSKMGQADYDLGIITFRDQVVTSSTYRSFTEEEFKKLDIILDAEQ